MKIYSGDGDIGDWFCDKFFDYILIFIFIIVLIGFYVTSKNINNVDYSVFYSGK